MVDVIGPERTEGSEWTKYLQEDFVMNSKRASKTQLHCHLPWYNDGHPSTAHLQNLAHLSDHTHSLPCTWWSVYLSCSPSRGLLQRAGMWSGPSSVLGPWPWGWHTRGAQQVVLEFADE